MREIKVAFALAWVIQIIVFALLGTLCAAITGWVHWNVFFSLLGALGIAAVLFFLWKPRLNGFNLDLDA